jgi:hypothetical protein
MNQPGSGGRDVSDVSTNGAQGLEIAKCERAKGRQHSFNCYMVVRVALRGLACLVAALLLPACGGRSPLDGGASDDGDTTNNGGGGSSSGGRSGGQANECDAFANEPTWLIPVRLSNHSKRPLYLGPRTTGCAEPNLPFTVSNASGMTLQAPSSCLSTCQDLAHGFVTTCAPIPCVGNTAVTLQPGESWMQPWSGVYMVAETLPAGCPSGSAARSCTRVRAIEPGEFTFAATAGASLDCSRFGGTCTTCLRDDSGGCTTYGAVVAGPELRAVTTLHLDSSYGVGPNGGGPHPVELVFQD